jgi:CRP-like cAMP-binding protein
MDRTTFLKQTALFSGFSDKDLADILATARQRTFDPGAAIIKEGDQGATGFYLVLSGRAEVRKGATVLDTMGPGAYFGEMALLLENTARTADVVAVEPTSCLVMTRWDLKATLSRHPELGVKMMGELAKRLANTDRALSD